MVSASYVQSSFKGGEWSKVSQGHIENPAYRTAMNVCLNGLPMEEESWNRRAGTRHGAVTHGGVAAKVIGLDFQEASPYTMELTPFVLRMFSDATIVTTNDDQTITDISTADPAEVTTGTHGWATGDTVIFDFTGATPVALCPLLYDRAFLITVTGTTTFTLADAVTGSIIDGSTLGWSSPTAGSATVKRILTIESPWSASEIAAVRPIQNLEKTVLVQGDHPPQLLTVVTEATESEYATFDLSTAAFKDGPYLDPIANTIVTPSALTGTITLTLSFAAWVSTKTYNKGDFASSASVNYRSLTNENQNHTPASSPTFWEVVDPGVAFNTSGLSADDIGRHIRMYSRPLVYSTSSAYSVGDNVLYDDVAYNCLQNQAAGTHQPDISPAWWVINPTGKRWTWGKITAVSSLIDRTLGTNIGSLTAYGGLASAFDGTTLQVYTSSASTGLARGYVGKDYGAGNKQTIVSAQAWPSSDIGFSNKGVIEITLYASNSLPADATDGTVLGTTGLIADRKEGPVSITSSDSATAYRYVWFYVNDASGDSNVTTVSEAQFYTPGAGGSIAALTVQILGSDLLYVAAIDVWRIGLYSAASRFPTCGTYHEGRLWLSGSVGNRIDGGRATSDLFDFAPTEEDGTVSDSNAVSYTFDAPDVNAVFWMEPDLHGIICGTQAGEWLIQATANNEILTPTNIQAHRITRNKCANIPPVRMPVTMAFVQQYKRKVMEYFVDVFPGKFVSSNLTKFAKHLGSRLVEELAYQHEPSPVLWARCADGSLIGCTYKREKLIAGDEPDLLGWHRHTLGSGRTVTSMTMGPSVDGQTDALAMVTYDATSTVYHVEFMTKLFEETDDPVTDAWFCDNALAPTAMEQTVSDGVTSLVLHGFWHLEGASVDVYAGGLDAGAYTVTNGSVTIPLPAAGGLLTTTYIATFGTLPVVVGFSYNSDGQLVRPATPVESGARTGPANGKRRRTNHWTALLDQTQGMSVGTSFAKLQAITFRTDGGTAVSAPTAFSGVVCLPLTDASSFDSMLCWRISRPFPATIASIGGFLVTVDNPG